MESAAKAFALWGALFCGAARAQFIFDLKEPQRSGTDLAFYLGAVYVYDTNVYLDEAGTEPSQIARGLAALSYESETPNQFFRLGYEFVYPYYFEAAELNTSDITEFQHGALLMYDRSFSYGKILLSDEFRLVSDPVNVVDPIPFGPYTGNMTRMVNKLDPRLRVELGALGMEVSAVWEFSDYSPSQLDYLDYQDLSFHGEAFYKSKGKWEAFFHYGQGSLGFADGAGGGVDYDHMRIYGGVRGEPSPNLGFEIAGGILDIRPEQGEDASDYYLSLRTTWEPTPGISRLLLSYRRDVRPTALPPYAIVNGAELSYGHWLKSRFHVELGVSYEAAETPKANTNWRTIGAFGGVRYEFKKFKYLFIRGEYRTRDSDIPGTSFDHARLMSGLVYRF